MLPGKGRLIGRKILTTLLTTIMISELLVFLNVKDHSAAVYNQGHHFIFLFFIYLLYSGAIILLYGNLVSIGIEYLLKKWFQQRGWLYVSILGAFGLVLGIYGVSAAVLYAIIDIWLDRRNTMKKGVKLLFLIPVASLFLSWGYLQFTSPPLQPFTKDDAVKFVTSGSEVGSGTEHFPKEISKWEGTINGYQVTRETNAKEIGEDIYLVTFTESWKKGTVKASHSFSYKVERGGLSANDQKGDLPPYYGDI